EVGKEEIEKDNKALPDPTAKGDAASRRSLEIEEMTPATSSGLYTKVTEFLWGKNNAPVKPVEKVIQVGSRPQEYLVAIQQAVSGSRYSMPTLSSGKEIAEKGSIRLQWKYQGRDVTYWDDAPLTMTQTAKLELLNSLAKLLPTDGKPARDHFLMELKAEALKAWYEQHAAEETNIRIEQALPHEEKRSASEPATDDMSQSRDDYMAIERFLDEAIETDPEKKALAEFKFCLVYREFKRTQVEQGNADSGPEEFKQFLLCYLKGQQNILAETLRTSHENEITAETLHSQITKLEKLERAMNVLTTDNREQVLPILEPNRHSDDAYRSFAAAERAAGGAPEDNNVDLADRFIDLYAQYNESALITSIEPFNEFLLRHYWRRAEQPNGESIKINLEAIQAVLTPDRSPSTDLPLADIQPFVVRRYDSGIGIDDDFESPLPPQSEHEAAHADAAAKAPDRLPRSDTFSSTDSAYFEDDDLEEALPQHLASEATIADKALQQDNAPIEGAQRTMSLTAWSAAFPEFHAQIMEGLRRIRPGAHVINTKVANLNDSSPELPLAGGRRVCVDEKTAAMAIYRPSDDTVYIAPKALSLQLMFNENKVISGWKAEPQNRKKTNQGPKRH
ncbi:MAG TPA: hypothetical protein VM532_09505, partial [Burkholderiales bacterium]|nr:hypothetical protein [Burkholderiales bacterium]